MVDIKQRDENSLQSYLTRFNDVAAAVKIADESLIHKAIVFGVNRKTEFSRDLTKQESKNLTDFYWRSDQYLRLEAADSELMLTTQTGTSGPLKEEAKKKNSNGRGKRKANDKTSGGKKDNRPKHIKGMCGTRHTSI